MPKGVYKMKIENPKPRKPLSIFDFHCEKCEAEGRSQPVEIVMGGASKGKHPESAVICGTCDSVIHSYLPSEMDVKQVGPHGDNEDFRLFMSGEHPLQLALEEEE
jgi:hypothetical protein